MKKWIVVGILMMMLIFVGCIPTEKDIITLTSTVSKLMVEIDSTQSSINQLAKDGLLSSEMADRANENIDKIQNDVTAVAKAIEESAKDPLKAAQAAIKASEPFNPYAKEMQLGLGIITIAAGWFANQKRKEGNDLNEMMTELETKYKAMKRGTENFKVENPDKAAELYANIGKERVNRGLT